MLFTFVESRCFCPFWTSDSLPLSHMFTIHAPCMAHMSSLRIYYITNTHLPVSCNLPASIKMSKLMVIVLFSNHNFTINCFSRWRVPTLPHPLKMQLVSLPWLFVLNIHSFFADALVAALVDLNMSPMNANSLVMVIQAVASSKPSTPSMLPPNYIPEHADDAADPGGPPPTNAQSLVPTTISNIAAAIDNSPPPTNTQSPVPTTISNITAAISNPQPPTNAQTPVLLPTFISHRGFTYEIPHMSAQPPFYCVTNSKHVGVLSTW